MIKVDKIEGKGRGVVATEDIPRGRLVCASSVLFFPRGALHGTPLENHGWSEEDGDYLTLGTQSLCNHCDDPNCVSVMHDGMDLLISIKHIKQGDELTLCYFDFEP